VKNGIIPFEVVETLNVGRLMNLSTGIFTASVSGLYHFDFSGMKKSTSYLIIQLLVNGVNFATAYGDSAVTWSPLTLIASLRLKMRDKVYLRKEGDGVQEYSLITHFSGWPLAC